MKVGDLVRVTWARHERCGHVGTVIGDTSLQYGGSAAHSWKEVLMEGNILEFPPSGLEVLNENR